MGLLIYAVAPETVQVWRWPKSLDAVTSWALPQGGGPADTLPGARQVCCTGSDREGWDRIYLVLPNELQIWECRALDGRRELMHRMYSFTSLEGVWDTAGDSPLLCMRRGAPPGSHSKRLLVDLMTRQWEESCEWPDHIEFEDEMVCATHDGYLISVTKNLVQRDCGLALHGTASEHPARSRPEGWPGDAFRVMALPMPQGHHA